MTTETKVQHTPGPWETSCMAGHDPDDPDSEQAQWTIVAEGGGDMIADLADTEAWLPREVVQANAHLIEAAPELLEALEAALHALETPGDFTPEELQAVIEDADIARAKARGNRMPAKARYQLTTCGRDEDRLAYARAVAACFCPCENCASCLWQKAAREALTAESRLTPFTEVGE